MIGFFYNPIISITHDRILSIFNHKFKIVLNNTINNVTLLDRVNVCY